MKLDVLRDVDGIYKIYIHPVTHKPVPIVDKNFQPEQFYRVQTFVSLEKLQNQLGVTDYNLIDRSPPPCEEVVEPVTDEEIKRYFPKFEGDPESINEAVGAQAVPSPLPPPPPNYLSAPVIHEMSEVLQAQKAKNLINAKEEILKHIKLIYSLNSLKQKARKDVAIENLKFFIDGLCFYRPEYKTELTNYVQEFLKDG